MEYALGFVFSEDKRRVALIKKNRPEWQKGLLNGIGGHAEEGELPIDTMIREFMEETGCATFPESWSRFATLYGKIGDGTFIVFCFTGSLQLSRLQSITDEGVEIIELQDVSTQRLNMVENAPWLIFLALDHLIDGRPDFVNVHYPPRLVTP